MSSMDKSYYVENETDPVYIQFFCLDVGEN